MGLRGTNPALGSLLFVAFPIPEPLITNKAFSLLLLKA